MAVKLATKLKRFYGLGRYGIKKRTRRGWSRVARFSEAKNTGRSIKRYSKATAKTQKAHRLRRRITAAVGAGGGYGYLRHRKKRKRIGVTRKRKARS